MYGHHEFDLYEAIYTTRSMRRLKPDPVAPSLIVKVIEAATMGPSGHNRQPWVFIVVTEREAKHFVAERYRKAWEAVFTPVEREVVANDPASQRGRNLRSAKYLAEHIEDVPVMIFACVKKYTDRARAGQPMLGAARSQAGAAGDVLGEMGNPARERPRLNRAARRRVRRRARRAQGCAESDRRA